MPFDGDLIDEVGGKNMAMGQSASFTNDKNGKASSALDLNVGYVKAPNGVYFNGDFPITLWAMLRTASDWARILDFADGQSDEIIFGFSYSNTGKVLISVSISLADKTESYTDQLLILNQWVFLGATLKGNIAKIYVNGTLQSTGSSHVPRNLTRNNNLILVVHCKIKIIKF